MSILQPDMPLICMIGSQNVTFLFRRRRNVWRTIGRCFFFCQSFRAAASHYIISYSAVNSCLSPHIAVSGQCAIFLSGDGRGRVRGCIADSEMMFAHLTLCCCLPQAATNRKKQRNLARTSCEPLPMRSLLMGNSGVSLGAMYRCEVLKPCI